MPNPEKPNARPDAHLLDQLMLIDPELARKTKRTLSEKKEPLTAQEAAMLEGEAVNALSHDIEYGETVIQGLARLIVRGKPERIEKYLEVTKAAAQKGLNLARMIARYWMPVLIYGDRDMLERFPAIVQILLKKGEYTLKKPFDYLSRLLENGSHQTSLSFLGLLADAFSQELPYALSLKLARLLPQSVNEFPEVKKNWQISQLRRVVREDVALTAPFLKSMETSLHMLSEDGLRRFITMGLEKYEKNKSLGLKFLSLASKLGIDVYQELLVTVSLPRMREGLNRYLQARTGLRLSVRPLSTLPGHAFSNETTHSLVCSDGQFIYLADDICHFENQAANRRLYKCLTRLESAYYEFGTFSFDLDRAMERCGLSALCSPSPRPGVKEELQHLSDAERFFRCFSNPEKAEALFAVFEQGRIRLYLERHYPGIVRSAFPLLMDEINKIRTADPMTAFFAVIGLGMSFHDLPKLADNLCTSIQKGLNLFQSSVSTESPVEASALLVHQFYPEFETLLSNNKKENPAFDPPFGRKIRFDLHHAAFREMDKISRIIKKALAKKGLKTYRADIQKELIQKGEFFSKEDLANLAFSGRPDEKKKSSADTSGEN
jgi:nitric oxide reductase NorD protein